MKLWEPISRHSRTLSLSKMSKNLELKNFEKLFQKSSDIFNTTIQTVSQHVNKQDIDTANFLGYNTPEVFCLVRLLGYLWNKNNNIAEQQQQQQQHVNNIETDESAVQLTQEQIGQLAYATTATLNETGGNDFGTEITQELIENSLQNIVNNNYKDDLEDDIDISIIIDTFKENDMQINLNERHSSSLPSPNASNENLTKTNLQHNNTSSITSNTT